MALAVCRVVNGCYYMFGAGVEDTTVRNTVVSLATWTEFVEVLVVGGYYYNRHCETLILHSMFQSTVYSSEHIRSVLGKRVLDNELGLSDEVP